MEFSNFESPTPTHLAHKTKHLGESPQAQETEWEELVFGAVMLNDPDKNSGARDNIRICLDETASGFGKIVKIREGKMPSAIIDWPCTRGQAQAGSQVLDSTVLARQGIPPKQSFPGHS